jgi:homoserine dehydrogenase
VSLRVGLLGCGNVGAAVARLLHEHASEIERRSHVRIGISRVAVRDRSKTRDAPIEADRFTDDPASVVADPDIDVVVEVLGGIEPARSLILAAFQSGKSVVTANKELLSTHVGQLVEAAAHAGADLLYEASVGGGIPVIRSLRESLAGDRIVRFMGIVNGTTNYILTRMTEEGQGLEEALSRAQELGYAEADPSADLDGHDAAAKAAILATIAFDVPAVATDVHREGIRGIRTEDVANARRLGYVIKLLAIGEASGDEEVSVRVHPAMLPSTHPLAAVRESFNAVYVEGEKVGPVMLYGRGAGGDPTATSVVGDLIELARSRERGGVGSLVGHASNPFGRGEWTVRRMKPFDDLATQYYILMDVADRPGVLAAIAGAFAEHRVSIRQVWQEGHGEAAQLVVITHVASEHALQACVRELRSIGSVREVSSVLRVEAAEP